MVGVDYAKNKSLTNVRCVMHENVLQENETTLILWSEVGTKSVIVSLIDRSLTTARGPLINWSWITFLDSVYIG